MLRFVRKLLIPVALGALFRFACAPSYAQEFMDVASPDATKPAAIDALPLGGALPDASASQVNGGAPHRLPEVIRQIWKGARRLRRSTIRLYWLAMCCGVSIN